MFLKRLDRKDENAQSRKISQLFIVQLINHASFRRPVYQLFTRGFAYSRIIRNEAKVPKFSPVELEAARLAREAGLGWLKHFPRKVIPYLELMRLEKPVGTWLLLLPCYWGITMASYSIAAPLWVTTKAIALFSVGA